MVELETPKWRNPEKSGQVGRPAGRRAQGGRELMFTVYAIKSSDRNYIYVGMTSDLEARLNRHNEGYERTTRAYRPFVLIHKEVFATRAEAREREKALKSGAGKEFLKALK